MNPDNPQIDLILLLLYRLGTPLLAIAMLTAACIRRPQLPRMLWTGMILMVLSQAFSLASLACGPAKIDELICACIRSEPDYSNFSMTIPSLDGPVQVSALYGVWDSVFSMFFGIALLFTTIALWRIARHLIATRLPSIDPL
jgi:hypothetical protein